jgi:hypothetical protein
MTDPAPDAKTGSFGANGFGCRQLSGVLVLADVLGPFGGNFVDGTVLWTPSRSRARNELPPMRAEALPSDKAVAARDRVFDATRPRNQSFAVLPCSSQSSHR